MKRILFLTLVLVAVSFLSQSVFAQTASANLTGTVRDDKGDPIPGVTVTAKNTETGLERTDVTTELGIYRFASLPFGIYDITAGISGFATQVRTDVRLDVGRTAAVDFAMKLSTTGEKIEVSGEAPLIERTESHIATVVTPEQVENLPLNSRQFANLGTLAPGTTLTPHPDPTRGATDMAVGINGGSGRNFNVTVDGGDDNDDTVGGVNQFYSLESVAEFTFLSNRYKAEYGRSSGGVLNVVTKSGTNDVHGAFFSLFRDDSLNAETESEKQAVEASQAAGTPVPETPTPYNRKQFGGNVGGPIMKDRAFFFFAAERHTQSQASLVNTQKIEPSLDFTSVDAPRHTNLITAKFTSNISPSQFLTVRYGQQETQFTYAAFPNYAPNARGFSTNKMKSILFNHNLVFSGDKLNEFAFQYADFHNTITPSSNDPTESFPAVGVYFGQNLNTPQSTDQEKYQFRDDYSFSSTAVKGVHHFKTGINFVHEPTLSGTFSVGTEAPIFTYAGADRSAPIVDISQFGGLAGSSTPNKQTGLYFQDDWNLNDKLTLNLGLRYDVVTGLGFSQGANSLYQALHVAAQQYDFSWLEPYRDNADGSIEMDKNNFQPRLGFAYDVKGDGTNVVRGGWGLYYDFPYTNANLLFPVAALEDYGLVYGVSDPNGIRNPDGSLFNISQYNGDASTLPPNQLPGVAHPTPRDVLSPDWKIPYTNQFSLGYSRELRTGSAVDFDYVHVAVRDQYVRFKFNGYAPGTQTRILPNFTSAPRMYTPLGYSDYNGFGITFRHQMTSKFNLQASYTLSKVEGNTLPGSDEFIMGAPGQCSHCVHDFTLGPKDDKTVKGPLNTDARHRVVLSGLYNFPYDIKVSGFFRANSAKPFNGYREADLNNDGLPYDTTDPHVNAHRGDTFSQLDLRLSKTFHIMDRVDVEGIFEVFNLFNAKNPNGLNANILGQRVIQDLDNPDFGTPLSYAGDPDQAEQRLAQLGFRIAF